jgi:rhodanese-related sulfurtransferase
LIEIQALGDKPVIMVCKTDKCSARAAEFLRDADFAGALTTALVFALGWALAQAQPGTERYTKSNQKL